MVINFKARLFLDASVNAATPVLIDDQFNIPCVTSEPKKNRPWGSSPRPGSV